MADVIEITDFSAPERDVSARLTGAQLRACPQGGLFIAEGVTVIGHALDAGYRIASLLMERRHIVGKAAGLIARCGDVPVYTADSRTDLERIYLLLPGSSELPGRQTMQTLLAIWFFLPPSFEKTFSVAFRPASSPHCLPVFSVLSPFRDTNRPPSAPFRSAVSVVSSRALFHPFPPSLSLALVSVPISSFPFPYLRNLFPSSPVPASPAAKSRTLHAAASQTRQGRLHDRPLLLPLFRSDLQAHRKPGSQKTGSLCKIIL